MALPAVVLCLMLFSVPQVEASTQDVLSFIDDIFLFLCNRCKDIVTTLDTIIQNQPFKKELDNLCRTFIPEPTVQSVCVNLVDSLLGGIYDQLQKLEPRPEFCTTIRLCNECGIPSFPTGNVVLPPPRQSAQFNFPTLPPDLLTNFGIEKKSPNESPFRRIRRSLGLEQREERDETATSNTDDAAHSFAHLRNRNDSEPFDPAVFYGKIAELATTLVRLRRMAEERTEAATEF